MADIKENQMKRGYPLHCWLMGGIDHGNLGDHQIIVSMEEFLRDIEPDLVIHEVPLSSYFDQRNYLLDKILPDDVLIFSGGGNVGTLWPTTEALRRDAFNTWPANPKIVFPQSVFFGADDEGARYLEESSRAYSAENCLFALRDPASYATAKEHFACRLFLTPDIALYSKIDATTAARSGCMLLMRSDKERALNDEERRGIEAAVRERFETVVIGDTVRRSLGKRDRKAALEALYAEICASSLVVTDRLHGMILSAISGTPCVVFANSYQKIRASMQWVDDLPYIRFAERAEDLPTVIDGLDLTKAYTYPQSAKQALFGEFRSAAADMLAASRKAARDQKPKVSVVIPVYNTAPYLEACMNSVVGQSLEDIEIICVNDGSTDGSRAILEDYARKDPRILVVDQENRGLSGARNTGLQRARGTYLYFLDSDDYIEPQALELLYDKMEEMQLEMLFFNAEPFSDGAGFDDRTAELAAYYKRKAEYPEIYAGNELLQLFQENKDYKPAAWGYLSKTAFLKDGAFRFVEGIYHEDNPYTFRCLTCAKRVAYIPDTLYHRRVREGSITTVKKSFKHAYGYFAGAAAMARYVQATNADMAFSPLYAERIASIVEMASSVFEKLPQEEQNKYKELPAEEAAYFQLLMLGERRNALRRKALGQELQTRNREKKQLESENKSLQGANRRLEKEKESLENINRDMKNSLSFRLGRAITWLPRGIRRLLRRLAGKAF